MSELDNVVNRRSNYTWKTQKAEAVKEFEDLKRLRDSKERLVELLELSLEVVRNAPTSDNIKALEIALSMEKILNKAIIL